MKTGILLLVVFVSFTAYTQIIEGFNFSELKGMEDKNGNTHLFYRLHYLCTDNVYIYTSSDAIWNLDLESQEERKFLDGYGYIRWGYIEFIKAHNFKFWNSDPSKYIYCGSAGWLTSGGFIKHYEVYQNYNINRTPVENIFISGQNDSLLLASSAPWLISKDGGRAWDTLLSYQDKDTLIGINPQRDSTIFFKRDKYLWKSNDLGFHSRIADSTFTPLINEPVPDADKKHVYFCGINKRGYYALFVSENEGEPGSFRECFESYRKIMLAADNSKPGCIYICDGYYIYTSNDFGKTFERIKSFKNKIIGIYKKPNSDKLYAADSYTIFEINKDQITEIKKLSYPQHLYDYYPLAIGNRWVYQTKTELAGKTINVGSKIREVTGDILLKNENRYFIIKEIKKDFDTTTTVYYERIDTTSGIVYRFNADASPTKEVAIRDLKASDGDTVSVIFYPDSAFNKFECRYFQTTKWNKLTSGLRFLGETFGRGAVQYELIKYFGEVNSIIYTDGPVFSTELKGCRIKGKVYGDTTATDVKKETEIPCGFALYQNYPNPFNPTTVIKYSLPKEARISLNVYNILGQKVKELVNQIKAPGVYEVNFDGSQLSSGIYFYRLQAGGNIATKKLIIAK